MTRQDVIRGLKIERECVNRTCEHDCKNCDLAQSREWITDVYDTAIKLLSPRKRRSLLPCPWCQSVASLTQTPLWQEYEYNGRKETHGYTGNYEYYVQCSNIECLAIAPGGKIDDIYRAPEDAMRIAKEIWNRRATCSD